MTPPEQGGVRWYVPFLPAFYGVGGVGGTFYSLWDFDVGGGVPGRDGAGVAGAEVWDHVVMVLFRAIIWDILS